MHGSSRTMTKPKTNCEPYLHSQTCYMFVTIEIQQNEWKSFLVTRDLPLIGDTNGRSFHKARWNEMKHWCKDYVCDLDWLCVYMSNSWPVRISPYNVGSSTATRTSLNHDRSKHTFSLSFLFHVFSVWHTKSFLNIQIGKILICFQTEHWFWLYSNFLSNCTNIDIVLDLFFVKFFLVESKTRQTDRNMLLWLALYYHFFTVTVTIQFLRIWSFHWWHFRSVTWCVSGLGQHVGFRWCL
jgi:hypothetical protein